jgi:dTDP-4-dehydrorhamnose 3,5-epimerase
MTAAEMVFARTALPGVLIISPEIHEDHRGFFARLWCEREFAAHGVTDRWVQRSVSYNKTKGTLRGMHYQRAPHQEAKLVRCARGAIYDVILDLRPDSPGFKRHVAVELSASNRKTVYIPEGCAHGFQTLEDDVEVLYDISAFYAPEHAAGVRWDDPAFGISWPDPNPIMSERDRRFPDFA